MTVPCAAHSGVLQITAEQRRRLDDHEKRFDDHEKRIRINEVFRVRGALLVTLVGTISAGVISTLITLFIGK